jgi:lipopolysaccharide transport system ATP-binding protein
MNDDVVIRVERLGRKYTIHHLADRPRYVALRDVIADTVGQLLAKRRTDGRQRDSVEEFWALRDVSFDVRQGEAVGIIGRNGAGKSTLLKVLSRITEPTTGSVRITGRVASLLEVGTGFHPELTGRENIFLNGAILSMSRLEIINKFDEIVEFADIGPFLDTPVKRYSSGMQMRLAFSVAAHLEPEILIVDEVLAVGDAQFQKKCLGKMGEVARGGRTVLFVSHNMGVVQSLTSRCVWLSSGSVAKIGGTRDVIAGYLGAAQDDTGDDVDAAPRISPDHGSRIRICRITPLAANGSAFHFGEDLVFEVRLRSSIRRSALRFGVTISDLGGIAILSTFTPATLSTEADSEVACRVVIPASGLAPGTYTLAIVKGGPQFAVASVSTDDAGLFRWRKDYGFIVNSASRIEPVQHEVHR